MVQERIKMGDYVSSPRMGRKVAVTMDQESVLADIIKVYQRYLL